MLNFIILSQSPAISHTLYLPTPNNMCPENIFQLSETPSPTFEFFSLVPLQSTVRATAVHISCEVTHPHARVGRVGPWPGCYGPDLAWIALSGLDFRPVYVKYGLWLGAGWLAAWLSQISDFETPEHQICMQHLEFTYASK